MRKENYYLPDEMVTGYSETADHLARVKEQIETQVDFIDGMSEMALNMEKAIQDAGSKSESESILKELTRLRKQIDEAKLKLRQLQSQQGELEIKSEMEESSTYNREIFGSGNHDD